MKDIRTAIKKADTKHVLKIGKMRHKIVLLREEYDGLKQGKKKSKRVRKVSAKAAKSASQRVPARGQDTSATRSTAEGASQRTRRSRRSARPQPQTKHPLERFYELDVGEQGTLLVSAESEGKEALAVLPYVKIKLSPTEDHLQTVLSLTSTALNGENEMLLRHNGKSFLLISQPTKFAVEELQVWYSQRHYYLDSEDRMTRLRTYPKNFEPLLAEYDRLPDSDS